MKYPIFSLRDVKANAFCPPYVCVNEAVARRDFDYRLHNDNSMGFSPSDYELYRIGAFDSDLGKIEPEMPEFIVSGAELF